MLTSEQLQTLKADIALVPEWTALPLTNSAALLIADAYNAAATPDFIVWRTNVSIDEIMRNGMAWDRVDNLTTGKARIWDWIGRLGTFDASKPNIRAGIDAAWVGTAADLAVRATVYTHCKRKATKVEKLFATGTGSGASPATMAVEGRLSADDVAQAREMA